MDTGTEFIEITDKNHQTRCTIHWKDKKERSDGSKTQVNTAKMDKDPDQQGFLRPLCDEQKKKKTNS